MKPSLFGLLIASLLITAGAEAATVQTADGPVRVRDWGYQLQGQQPGPLGAAPHDLLVIDFARFGDEESKFTPQEVAAMQNSVGGDGKRKVVTAYLSIGEASEFRSYWDTAWTANGTADSPLQPGAPSWLGPVNPDWDESRKIRYWDADWQSVIFNDAGDGWLDQIVTQGFDGAYLDIIDAYYFWGNDVDAADQRPGDPFHGEDAARRMVEFVVAMTAHARQTNPSFFVIPQNGEFLLNDLRFGPDGDPGDPDLAAAYLDAIAAIAIEDTYYRGDEDENNPLDPDAEKVQVLKDDFLAAGKPVLVVDYINQPAKVNDFQQRARTDGFIPYAAPTRGLDSLGSAAPKLAGDFDGNGLIEPTDYALWRDTHGSVTNLDADANEDGVVDAADYTVWRAATAAGLTLIPEPVTLTIAMLSVVVFASSRRL